MSTERVNELKRSLDELTLAWEPFEDDLNEADLSRFRDALARFRDAGPELLDEASPYVWAYYHRERAAFSPDERKAYGIPEIPDHDDIWDHVRVTFPPMVAVGGHPLQPGASYVAFEGEVPWEPEHGLDLVFEDGCRLVKVGPCDGHSTNAHAYGDESLVGVIFVE